MDSTYNSVEDLCPKTPRKGNVSLSDELAGFGRLRISALTKAAEISPMIKEVTIGPNSPIKKTISREQNSVNKENKHEENLIQDLVRDDNRHTLIMKEYENRLQETSEELFKNLVERMISNRAETMTKYWKKQSEECERRALEVKARKLQMLKELQENDNLTVLEKARLDQQRSQQINKQTVENMNRILEEQNLATSRFAAITDSHTKICLCYNDITNVILADPDSKSIREKYVASVNSVVASITKILDLCKSGTIHEKDVKQAEVLAANMDNIKKKIIDDLNEVKQQELAKLQQQLEEANKKELEEKKAQEVKANKLAELQKLENSKSAVLFHSQKNYIHHQELKNFLEEYESKYKMLLENVKLKKFRFDCQKAVNTPVNALSSVSGSHIRDKFEKLSTLLKGERVQVLDTFVTAAQHYPDGLYYCTALLAKKIVKQGELLVSSNPEAAFPLAAISVALWAQFPEFGKLLEANFHRQCPYLVPMFLPQTEGQSDKEFYLSRGYTYNDEGVVEKHDKFLKRMSGIFRLYCAIWIAKTPRFLNAPNPHGLNYGWQWLASFINLKPEPDISATLLHDFFTVCGSQFLKIYSKQFVKVIRLVSTQYLAILQNIDEGGPKTRLEVFLQNVLKTGIIDPPRGLLEPNSW